MSTGQVQPVEPIQVNENLSLESQLHLALMETAQITYDLAQIIHIRAGEHRNSKIGGVIAGLERTVQRLKAAQKHG